MSNEQNPLHQIEGVVKSIEQITDAVSGVAAFFPGAAPVVATIVAAEHIADNILHTLGADAPVEEHSTIDSAASAAESISRPNDNESLNQRLTVLEMRLASIEPDVESVKEWRDGIGSLIGKVFQHFGWK